MMNQSALLRPDWTPATVALMVLGFMVFWPLGLAMLAYIVFGDRFRSFKQSANQTADGLFSKCRSGGFRNAHFSTGNVAFDDWRKAELDRIAADKAAQQERLARYRTEAAAHAAAMSDYAAQLAAARADRERWEADVAACRAGDRLRCGVTDGRR